MELTRPASAAGLRLPIPLLIATLAGMVTLFVLSVLINTHLLQAAVDGKVSRYFYASSACVYNGDKQKSEDIVPLKEEDAYPAMPEDGYGWEKLFSERMCRHFREDFGLVTRVARFHNVYGPFGTWRTVESLAGVRLDHMAILDFEGFRDLTTALGGVEVRVPETVRDPQLGRTWEKGAVSLEGQDALDYVRMRYGLENGDFDRVRRQQNFLRAVVGKLGDDGTTDDPRRLLDTVEALAAPLTVDEGWTSRAMASW